MKSGKNILHFVIFSYWNANTFLLNKIFTMSINISVLVYFSLSIKNIFFIISRMHKIWIISVREKKKTWHEHNRTLQSNINRIYNAYKYGIIINTNLCGYEWHLATELWTRWDSNRDAHNLRRIQVQPTYWYNNLNIW